MAVVTRKQYESGQVTAPAPVLETPVAEMLPAFPELPAPVSKPGIDDPWFALIHPDATDAHEIACTFSLEIDGRVVEVKLVRSRFETQDAKVRDALLARGYRWMNEEY